MSRYLRITYAPQDAPALPLIVESFLRGYEYATEWFDRQGSMPFDLWMAPDVDDLRYMTCRPHDETFFCAPGDRDGYHIILFVSPLARPTSAGRDRLPGVFAHEITHHLVRDISGATPFSMKRKERGDVPMWLEEGLCQYMESEVCPSLRESWSGRIAAVTEWYDWGELWNDLSSCEDVGKAYLQAYGKVRALLETKGRVEIIRLLYLNRTREADWADLPHGGSGSAR